jgi:predicted dienelactone hydrolase
VSVGPSTGQLQRHRPWASFSTGKSRAIDAINKRRLLEMDRVGMYGMSAGGHTALTLAGGSWSPARLLKQCEEDIANDFNSCVGLAARLTGGRLDGLKKTLALSVIRRRLNDATWYTHADPRVAAVVAGVPFAADFDMASLATPRVPLPPDVSG